MKRDFVLAINYELELYKYAFFSRVFCFVIDDYLFV